MENSRGGATMRDVARLADVHPSTVSRALTGSRSVSPELHAAIQSAADTLGYRIDPLGRALRTRSTATVGMLVPDINNPFFPAVIQAIERALHSSGLGLFLCDAQTDPRVEADRITALVNRRVDGLVVCPVHRTHSAAAVRSAAAQIPVVQVNRFVSVPTDYVGIDQAAGIEAIVEHLLATGRRRFALLTGDDSISAIAERTEACRRCVADAPGAELTSVYHVDHLTTESGWEATSRLLEEKEVPDALVCSNDLAAVGAMQRLRAAGVAVPDSVAVTGFDDTSFAQLVQPPLTTVCQSLDQMGQETVRLLRGRLEGGSGAFRKMLLSPELVVRGSSASTADDSARSRV